jgi:hypothetical protein
VTEPENRVLQLLREMREESRLMREENRSNLERVERRIDDLGAGLNSLRADVASDLMTLEKRLGDQIAGLRRSVMEYHSSAIGHGVLISELEERVRRIEARLPPEGHWSAFRKSWQTFATRMRSSVLI